jgi:hypothetical protein
MKVKKTAGRNYIKVISNDFIKANATKKKVDIAFSKTSLG